MYPEMIRLKTGALFRAVCQIGALLGGADPQLAAGLARYGEHLGMAFQIRDDLLSYLATPEQTGKPATSDLNNGRPTLPLLLAYDAATDTSRVELMAVLHRRGAGPADVEWVAGLLDEVDAVQGARRQMAEHAERALRRAGRARPLRQRRRAHRHRALDDERDGVSTAGAVRALRAHVETWRPYTLWYVGLVGLAGAALADGPHHPWLLASAWAAPTAGWLGGHYLGDYFDRELDAGSKPHRPIPSGRLGARTRVWCGCICFALLALLAVLGGWGTTSAAVLAAFGIVAYSRWCKARGIAGNLVRGALGAIALLYGALTVGLSADRGSTVPVLLAAMVAFWSHDAMSNLVGALRDIDGDRAGGYRTLPVRRGAPFAVRTVLALYAVPSSPRSPPGCSPAGTAGSATWSRCWSSWSWGSSR